MVLSAIPSAFFGRNFLFFRKRFEFSLMFLQHFIIRSEGDVMEESKYIYLSHNASNLVYHIVCSAKYCRVVFDETVDEHLKQICLAVILFIIFTI